ncbi:MAG: hypothetical protein LRY71_19700 [Bacillaceae bacterium]|nr:hypothetical protein [Bacillaceae bacterium]
MLLNTKNGSEDVIVRSLVETREYFTDETKHDYFVIYEKFTNSDCCCGQNGLVQEIECDDEEIIRIFQGNLESGSSLRNIKSYCLGKDYKSVEDILVVIQEEQKEIFK